MFSPRPYCRVVFFIAVIGIFSCKHASHSPKESNPVLIKPPIAALTDAISQAPTAEAYFRRGIALHRLEQDSLALNDFNRSVKLDSTKGKYYSAIGNLLFEHKDLSGSIPYLQKALARDPQDVQAHLKLAKAMIFTKDYGKAFTEINTVLRNDAYNPEGYYLKGIIYKEMKDTARALSSFQTAVNAVPDYKDAIVQIGLLQLAQGNTIGLQYLENAFKIDTTDVFPLYAKGMWQQDKGDAAMAKEEYTRAIMHDRQYANAYFNIGYLLLQEDSLAKALRQFDLVTKVAPTDARAYYNRGLCSELMGDKTAAIQDYRQTLDFDKDFAQAQQGLKRLGGTAN